MWPSPASPGTPQLERHLASRIYKGSQNVGARRGLIKHVSRPLIWEMINVKPREVSPRPEPKLPFQHTQCQPASATSSGFSPLPGPPALQPCAPRRCHLCSTTESSPSCPHGGVQMGPRAPSVGAQRKSVSLPVPSIIPPWGRGETQPI